jgi:hypothetical protein
MNFGDKRKSGERDSSLYEHRGHWNSPLEPVPQSPSNCEQQYTREVLLTIIRQSNYVLYSFLSKEFTKRAKNLEEKQRLRRELNRIVNNLVKIGVLEEIRISERERILSIADTKKAFDLISCPHARNPHEMPPIVEKLDKVTSLRYCEVYKSLLPQWSRIHEEHYKVAKVYFVKPPARLTDKDLREITSAFERYIFDVSDKYLLFRDEGGDLRVLPYKTRYTSLDVAVEKVKKFEYACDVAIQRYDYAIFVTITVPPIFPLKLCLWFLSYVMHRLKALIRKYEHETKPHLKVIEPQRSLNPHLHALIFGLNWIMPKEKFTFWLDEQLERFLERLGDNYKSTINKRAGDERVRQLNKYGRRMLKRYRKYKEKQRRKETKSGKKFTGPINHITVVRKVDNDYEFDEPPRDAKTRKVFEYLKYYVLKNLYECKRTAEDKYRKQSIEIAFYWLLRIQFFYVSPILRPPPRERVVRGWEFIGSFRWGEIVGLFNCD